MAYREHPARAVEYWDQPGGHRQVQHLRHTDADGNRNGDSLTYADGYQYAHFHTHLYADEYAKPDGNINAYRHTNLHADLHQHAHTHGDRDPNLHANAHSPHA